jgi:hypothetical protein
MARRLADGQARQRDRKESREHHAPAFARATTGKDAHFAGGPGVKAGLYTLTECAGRESRPAKDSGHFRFVFLAAGKFVGVETRAKGFQ